MVFNGVALEGTNKQNRADIGQFDVSFMPIRCGLMLISIALTRSTAARLTRQRQAGGSLDGKAPG